MIKSFHHTTQNRKRAFEAINRENNRFYLRLRNQACAVPTKSACQADYDKRLELLKNISKMKKKPMGILSKSKDQANKCEIETDL